MDVMLPAGWAPDKDVICRYILIEVAARVGESAGSRPPSQRGGGWADEDRGARIGRDRRGLRGAGRERRGPRLVPRAWRAPAGGATTAAPPAATRPGSRAPPTSA